MRRVKNELRQSANKKFDPKKCPYEQIEEHKGTCIVYVSEKITPPFYDTKKKIIPSRIRLVTRDGCYYANTDAYSDFEPSCYAVNMAGSDFLPRNEIVRKMRRYDNRSHWNYTVVHIEFYPHRHLSYLKDTLGKGYFYED